MYRSRFFPSFRKESKWTVLRVLPQSPSVTAPSQREPVLRIFSASLTEGGGAVSAPEGVFFACANASHGQIRNPHLRYGASDSRRDRRPRRSEAHFHKMRKTAPRFSTASLHFSLFSFHFLFSIPCRKRLCHSFLKNHTIFQAKIYSFIFPKAFTSHFILCYNIKYYNYPLKRLSPWAESEVRPCRPF